MEHSLKAELITVLICMSPFFSVYGQHEPAEADSTFEEYMRTAWNEIRESERSDSMQVVYSNEFYEYYLANPETETGGRAFAQAFMMWGNTGNAQYIDEALETLDDDSDLWRMIIMPLGNIHYRNEDLGGEVYEELLDSLSGQISEPEGKSEVLLALLRISMRDESKERATELARRLVELDATEFHVNQGLGYLHELESLNIGQQAPDFVTHTIDGDEISLSALEGRFVLLEFWATWCGPCIPEIPHLQTLDSRFDDSEFKILGISLDRDKNTLREFIEEHEMEWPQIFVDETWEGELTRLFNVSGIPRMYLIGPDGRIIDRDLRGEEMVTQIKNIISEYSWQ